MLGCGFVEREEVLLTGTDLINVKFICLSCLLRFVILLPFCMDRPSATKEFWYISFCLLVKFEVFAIQVGICTNVSVQGHGSLLCFKKCTSSFDCRHEISFVD